MRYYATNDPATGLPYPAGKSTWYQDEQMTIYADGHWTSAWTTYFDGNRTQNDPPVVGAWNYDCIRREIRVHDDFFNVSTSLSVVDENAATFDGRLGDFLAKLVRQ